MKPVCINVEELSKCGLNDFEVFDHCLFTEEELQDSYKWRKFFKPGSASKFTVGIPFDHPHSIVEYQICHYILWNCIAYNNSTITKPNKIINCITSKIIQKPQNCCFACEYDSKFERKQFERKQNGVMACTHCPIWGNQTYTCEACVETIYGSFSRWSQLYYFFTSNSPETARLQAQEEALTLATIPWIDIP